MLKAMAPKKRILYIITKSNFGGAQRYVFELALAMHEQRHEVAVACGGSDELVTRLRAVNIPTFKVEGFQRDVSLFNEFKAFFSLRKIIREFKPDIVHLNSAKAGGLGALVGRILSVPQIIFTAHGWPFLEPRSRTWKTLAWLGSYFTSILAHKIIVVSKYDFDHSKMPGVKNKLTIIHTAVTNFLLLNRDEARNALLPKAELDNHLHNIWLVTIAELNPNKNHTTAINAIAEFNTSHSTKIFYSIIGSGELIGELKDQVDLKGLNDYVHFFNYLKDARGFLLAFDIFLLPSKKEGLPYALLEAGLAELPCVASKVGGISEIIIDRESGLLTDPNNHVSIVVALDYLINNPDKRSLYSENLSNNIKENFNLEIMLEQTKKLYNS